MMETQIYLLAWIVFFPLAGAAVTYLAGRADKVLRDRMASAVTVAEFLMLLVLLLTVRDSRVFCQIPGICQMGLTFESDGFRSVYALIAAFMWMMTTLFSGEYFASYRNRNRRKIHSGRRSKQGMTYAFRSAGTPSPRHPVFARPILRISSSIPSFYTTRRTFRLNSGLVL